MSMLVPGSERFDAPEWTGQPAVGSPAPDRWEGDGRAVEPISFEVIAHKLDRVADEYAATISKVSGSVIVTEAFDYNVCLADEVGDIFAMGRGATVLAAVLQDAIRWTLEHRAANPGIEDGDVFLVNDPWVGGTHQPDTALLVPIFVDGRLFCWAASVMHLLDVGGPIAPIQPGARTVFEEAAPTPPIKLVRRGELQLDVEDMFVRRSKLPTHVTLDLRAMLAAANVASARLHELVDAYGARTVHRVLKQVLDTAEAGLRQRLRRLPDGVWRHRLLMESSGPGDRSIYQVTVSLTKRDDTLHFDFSDCDAQAGFLNATAAHVRASATCSLLPTLCQGLPWAPGALSRVATFTFEKGTIASSQFPAATSGGTATGGIMAVNVCAAVVGKMLAAAPDDMREQAAAVGLGSIPVWILHGLGRGGYYSVSVLTDVISGGSGASRSRDGVDLFGPAVSTAVMFANVESLERVHPLLYLYRREACDGGGAGRFRGGTGGEVAAILHDIEGPLGALLASWGFAFPTSAGLNGGLPARSNAYVHCVGSEIRERIARGQLPASVFEVGGDVQYPHMSEAAPRAIDLDDVYHLSWPGGGGYGDALERDPESVLHDVRERYVSHEAARRLYGVVIADGDVDRAATDALRAVTRGSRLGRGPLGAPPPPDLASGARRLDETLQVKSGGEVACARCATQIAVDGESYKLHTRQAELGLQELGLTWVDQAQFIDEPVVLRQYACPGCGVLLECEITRPSDAPLRDRHLAPIGPAQGGC